MTTETEFSKDLTREIAVAQDALRAIVERSRDRNLLRANGAVAAARLGGIAKTALAVLDAMKEGA